jgi:small subunit ribosomal protein S8
MSMTDPVADLLTRIRNASKARKPAVNVPASNLKREIVRILKERSYIRDYTDLPDRRQGVIRIHLRYSRGDEPIIKGIARVSRPGLRKYWSADEVQRSTFGHPGIAVLSTSSGLMTNFDAAKKRIGGEVMLRCW